MTIEAYQMTEGQFKDLDRRFTYHKPFGTQPDRYHALREMAKALAVMITNNTPISREQSLALTHLEETIFWANASIARNEVEANDG